MNKKINQIKNEFSETQKKFAKHLCFSGYSLDEYIEEIINYSEIETLNQLSCKLAPIIKNNRNIKELILIAQVAERSSEMRGIINEIYKCQNEFKNSLLEIAFRYIFLNTDKRMFYTYLNNIKAPVILPVKQLAVEINKLIDNIDKNSTGTFEDQIDMINNKIGFEHKRIADEILSDPNNYNLDSNDYTRQGFSDSDDFDDDDEEYLEELCDENNNWYAWFWTNNFIDTYAPKPTYSPVDGIKYTEPLNRLFRNNQDAE